jgi:hypothetical protein
MQIDWQRAINDILASKLCCPRCSSLVDEAMIGYLRTPEAAQWAPLCEGCSKRDNCDARKLVECRRTLDESIEYIAEFWREDLDVDPADADKRLEELEPDLFEEEDNWRRYVEEQYLRAHAWLREHHVAVPSPGWRSEYVEEVISAGYTTLLGD